MTRSVLDNSNCRWKEYQNTNLWIYIFLQYTFRWTACPKLAPSISLTFKVTLELAAEMLLYTTFGLMDCRATVPFSQKFYIYCTIKVFKGEIILNIDFFFFSKILFSKTIWPELKVKTWVAAATRHFHYRHFNNSYQIFPLENQVKNLTLSSGTQPTPGDHDLNISAFVTKYRLRRICFKSFLY